MHVSWQEIMLWTSIKRTEVFITISNIMKTYHIWPSTFWLLLENARTNAKKANANNTNQISVLQSYVLKTWFFLNSPARILSAYKVLLHFLLQWVRFGYYSLLSTFLCKGSIGFCILQERTEKSFPSTVQVGWTLMLSGECGVMSLKR